jgi:hypothetical protein
MKNYELVLQSFLGNNKNVEHVQRRLRRSTNSFAASKGTHVFTIMLILGTASAVGIVSSFVVTARDGYRRQPRETFARTV